MNLTPCCERDIENGFHEALGAESEILAESLVQVYAMYGIKSIMPGTCQKWIS
jgi:hypothetical protein